MANAHRHVEELIADSPKKSLFDLFAEDNPVVAGADLTGAAAGPRSSDRATFHVRTSGVSGKPELLLGRAQ